MTLSPKQGRYAKWLAVQSDTALLTVRTSLTGDIKNDVDGELRRRGVSF